MIALALSASFALAAPQDNRTLELDDGRRAEFGVVTLADGREVRHGEFKVFAPAGTRLVSGEYENGVRTGRWVYRHRSGEVAAAGKFKDGVRSGSWKMAWPDGLARAKGRFSKGRPTGKWKVHDAAGVVDARLSGQFEVRRGRGVGLLVHGLPFERWCRTAGGGVEHPDGSLAFESELELGVPVGAPSFAHVGGVVDPEFFVSGEPTFDAPLFLFRTPDEFGDPMVEGGSAAESAAPGDLGAAVASFAAKGGTEPTALDRTARLEMAAADLRAVVLGAVQAVAAVDWSDDAAREAALQIVATTIEPGLGFPGLGWADAKGDAAVERNRRATLRAHTLASIHTAEHAFWRIDTRAPRGRRRPINAEDAPPATRLRSFPLASMLASGDAASAPERGGLDATERVLAGRSGVARARAIARRIVGHSEVGRGRGRGPGLRLAP